MNKKLSIAIVVNTSWNIYNFRLGLLKSLEENGFTITAIAPWDNYSKELINLGYNYQPLDFDSKSINPFKDIKLTWQLYQLYKKNKPTILLHYTIKPNIYGNIAAWFAGIPVISNISGLGTVFLNDKLSSKIARFLYKISLKASSKVFFQNSADQSLFIHLRLVDKSKTGLLPGSGINIKKFPPSKQQNCGSFTSFLFVARLVKDKGLLEYMEASKILKAKYPNIKFRILGSFYSNNPTAISRDDMDTWEKKGIIEYLGTSDDAPSIMAQADCIVLPSYREGLSRVLLEAACMEKPIITTDTPGCRDVVDDSINGFLAKVRDSTDLAVQMDKMISIQPKKRIEMGIKGRKKIAKEFNEDTVIHQYRLAINDALESKNKSATTN